MKTYLLKDGKIRVEAEYHEITFFGFLDDDYDCSQHLQGITLKKSEIIDYITKLSFFDPQNENQKKFKIKVSQCLSRYLKEIYDENDKNDKWLKYLNNS